MPPRRTRATGSITQRSREDGAVWLLRYRSHTKPNGSQKVLGRVWSDDETPVKGYLTRTMAEDEAQRFLDAASIVVPDSRKTVERAREDYIRSCHRRQLRGSTLHAYDKLAARVCDLSNGSRRWGDMFVDEIGPEDLADLHDQLEERGLAADTLNHWHTTLKGMFGAQKLEDSGWRWIVPKLEARGSFAFYSPEQCQMLKARAHDARDRAIFTLATEAGLRMSEILGLPVKNVRFDVRKILVTQAYTATGGMAGPKSHEIRSVPMSTAVANALAVHCAGKPEDALVFSDNGHPISGINLYRRYRSAARAAGLPVLRFHDLRHTFGSIAITKFSPRQVQLWMGHANLKTTERYLHVKEDPRASQELTDLFAVPDSQVIPLRMVMNQ